MLWNVSVGWWMLAHHWWMLAQHWQARWSPELDPKVAPISQAAPPIGSSYTSDLLSTSLVELPEWWRCTPTFLPSSPTCCEGEVNVWCFELHCWPELEVVCFKQVSSPLRSKDEEMSEKHHRGPHPLPRMPCTGTQRSPTWGWSWGDIFDL